jgi:hypothetical protein
MLRSVNVSNVIEQVHIDNFFKLISVTMKENIFCEFSQMMGSNNVLRHLLWILQF